MKNGIYMVDIRQMEPCYNQALPLLTPLRLSKTLRYRQRADQLRSISAGLLLRHVLGITTDEQLHYGTFKKPFAPDLPDFNLSHGGNYVVLAVGDTALGVDMEPLSIYEEALAGEVLCPDELLWMGESPPERFARLWTRKESIMKAFGLGLYMPPESFSAMPVNEEKHHYRGKDVYTRDWLMDGHALSCTACFAPPPDQLVMIPAAQVILAVKT